MKNFFMRYGFIVLTVLFLVTGIVLISPLGAKIGDGLATLRDNFKETAVYKFFAGNNEIEIIQDMENYGYFTVIVTSDSEDDIWNIEYNYSDSSALWSGWTATLDKASVGTKEHTVYFRIDRIEPGIRLKFRAEKQTTGRAKTVESDIIVCQ